MAKWNKVVITDLGKELMANVISGSEIEFTKIRTSDYKFDSDMDLEKVTHIIDVKQEENIKNIEIINKTTVDIYSNFSNKELNEGYDVRVVGLYAKLKDSESEILYSITTTDKPDYLPAFNGVTLSSIDYKFVTAIGNSENVILDITEIDSVTKQQFDELQTDVEGLKTTTQSNHDKISILEEANTIQTADLAKLEKEVASHQAETVQDGVHGLKIETGTWSPVLTNFNGSSMATQSLASGSYNRIGNLIYITAIIVVDNYVSGNDYYVISGLPFTAITGVPYRMLTINTTINNVGAAYPTSNQISLRSKDISSPAQDESFSTTKRIYVSGIYNI